MVSALLKSASTSPIHVYVGSSEQVRSDLPGRDQGQPACYSQSPAAGAGPEES